MRAQHDTVNTQDRLLIEPTHLWYHDGLQNTVDEILDPVLTVKGLSVAGTVTDYVGGSGTNLMYKKLIPVPLPLNSASALHWGLFAARPGGGLGPVLWQYDPTGGNFRSLDADNDEPNFMRRELFYGTEMWGAIAPGFPQFIWGSTGT
jgi:hypothetical protein